MAAREDQASTTPVPVGVQRLAAQLVRRMPWLARGRHIGALVRLLHRHGLDADAGWTAQRLLDVLEQQQRTTGRTVADPAQQRNPLGYLHTLLTAASPRLAAALRPGVPRPVAAWRVEDEARRRQLAAEDPALRAAAIARLRAQMAAEQAVRPQLPRVGGDETRASAARSRP